MIRIELPPDDAVRVYFERSEDFDDQMGACPAIRALVDHALAVAGVAIDVPPGGSLRPAEGVS